MKHRVFFFLTIVAGIFCTNVDAAPADDAAEQTAVTSGKKSKKKKKSEKSQKEAQIGPVGKALQGAEFFTEVKPNPQATHYFFLESASWCGPCKLVMPKIVEEYPKMREAGVEVILVANEPEAAAKQYLEHYKAEFAGMLPEQAAKLPGYSKNPSAGVPSACLVDAEGNTVTGGHGRMLLQWRQLTNQPEKPGPGAVEEALQGMKFVAGKPLKNAKYYIYLHSSSTCVACAGIMPSIVKEYKKMKKSKVEIILIDHDSTVEEAKAYVKSSRIKFPAIMDDSSAKNLPGYTPVSGMPYAIIVDKHGTVIKQAHGSVVLEWKSFCP